jgi:hypothetical protein
MDAAATRGHNLALDVGGSKNSRRRGAFWDAQR